MRAQAAVPVVYILGAGHSGSTLLAMLLASHPEICTIGEVKALGVSNESSYRCSCGEIVANCSFWARLAEEVRQSDPPFTLFGGPSDIRRARTAYQRRMLRPLHRGRLMEKVRDVALTFSASWPEHARSVACFNAAVSRSACRVSDRRVFVDSSKTGLQFKCLMNNPELELKAIRLVRDARGVALSYKKAESISLEDAAQTWKRSNEEASIIVDQLESTSWFDLRYEDLCRDAAATLRRLFSFIGVNHQDTPISSPSTSQHVFGNDKMRLTGGQVTLDERWRRELDADALKAIDRIAGRLNRRLGYS